MEKSMLADKVKNALTETALNQFLGPDELDKLLAYVPIVPFSHGDVILQQRQYSSGIYIIIEGIVSVTAKTLEFEKANIATLSKGDFIGEISMLLGEPATASIVANGDVRCLFISNVYLEFLSSFYPDTKYKILLAIAHQICNRLINIHGQINAFLEKLNMTTQGILGKVFTSLNKLASLSYEEANFNKEILRSAHLFTLFDNDEYEQLLKHAELLRADKNCVLIKEKDKKSDCYIIIRGGVQSSLIHANKVAKLSVLGPATLFCSISSVDKASPSTINFSTCENTILLKLTEAKLAELQQNHKILWAKIFNLICKSLIALERSMQKLNIRLNIELYNR
jgi:CRP/FNR family transcriptional regulator, cyclic AMP receptor protein